VVIDCPIIMKTITIGDIARCLNHFMVTTNQGCCKKDDPKKRNRFFLKPT